MGIRTETLGSAEKACWKMPVKYRCRYPVESDIFYLQDERGKAVGKR
ncbi:hypothetical protein [Methanosarcina sp.]|nr:hypothetical protein [Methanosarcina sp.]